MLLNRKQKIATFLYCIFLVVTLLFLTPYLKIYGRRGEIADGFGNFFSLQSGDIVYPKLFIELLLLTIFYILSLLVLNKSKILN